MKLNTDGSATLMPEEFNDLKTLITIALNTENQKDFNDVGDYLTMIFNYDVFFKTEFSAKQKTEDLEYFKEKIAAAKYFPHLLKC